MDVEFRMLEHGRGLNLNDMGSCFVVRFVWVFLGVSELF